MKNIINGKEVSTQEVDISQLPPSTKITDLGFSNSNNTTKITIQDQTWKKSIAELIPSLGGTILFVIILFFLFTRMGPGGA